MNKGVPPLQIFKQKRAGNKELTRLNEPDFIVKDTLVARFHRISILSKEINSCELLTSIRLQFVPLSLPQSSAPPPADTSPWGGGNRVAVHLGFYLQDLVSEKDREGKRRAKGENFDQRCWVQSQSGPEPRPLLYQVSPQVKSS